MNRIQALFQHKKQNVLNVYCTAGFPELDSTMKVIRALRDNGADLVELGMPYSDPLADGPVIQSSGLKALENGMTIKTLFDQLQQLRASDKDGGIGPTLPVVLMGYMNPVLQYGLEKFCAKAAEVGIDGLIIPDLPGYEFETEYAAVFKKYNLDFIFLVTPETAEERIVKLDELSSGFLYAVSSSSTTGSDKNMGEVSTYLSRLQGMRLKNPLLVGFGIKDRETFAAACAHANGAIIGTAYIKAVEHATDIDAATAKFLKPILEIKEFA